MITSKPDGTSTAPADNFLLRTLQVVWRQRKRTLLFFAAVMTLVVVGAFVCPKTYQSEAKLFVRLGRESVTLDPTATTGKVVGVHESRENEMNSVLEVIQSRIVLERTVERLGSDAILKARVPATIGTTASLTTAKPTTANAAAKAAKDKAIRQLERMVYIKHPKKSSVITIGCKAASPELAQKIVEIVLEEFRELHLRINRTAGSRKFFEEQTTFLAGQLDTVRKELQAAKNRLGITTLDNRRKTLQELVRTNRAALQTNASELSGVRATIASLKETLASLPTRTVSQQVVGFPNGALDRARSQLNQLQIQERQLLTKYTEYHPDVIAVRQQIAQAREILKREGANGTQATTATNPTAQQLSLRLLTEQARAKSLVSKAEAIERDHQSLLAQLRDLNANEGHVTQLEQKVDLLQASHKAYSEKLEQARIDWALGEERISNVNTVQPPTYVSKAVSPKKRLIVFLGLIVAGIGAIGFAWLSEFLQRRKQRTSATRSKAKPSQLHSAMAPVS